MTKYIAEFSPESWISDYATPVDPEGPTKWDCTEAVAEYINKDGSLRSPFRLSLGDYLDNDDILRTDPAAPEWVREWRGPGTIRVTIIDLG